MHVHKPTGASWFHKYLPLYVKLGQPDPGLSSLVSLSSQAVGGGQGECLWLSDQVVGKV